MTIVFYCPDNANLAVPIAEKLACDIGEVDFRNFPDGESYLRIISNVKNKNVILICSLDNPNEKVIPLLFFARTVKDLGAKSVGILAPYLSYLRQDKRFNSGEAINSKIFGELISNYFDWIITVDPHLHRHKSLAEIYSIKTDVLHAMDFIAKWIKNNVTEPLLVGPDIESEQWVTKVADIVKAPHIILEKIRHGDADVDISSPEVAKYRNHTPVLIDDIISTARTMIETVKLLNAAKMKPTVCIGVHAIFAGDAFSALQKVGVEKIVTTNAIIHETNAIDISELFIGPVKKILKEIE